MPDWSLILASVSALAATTMAVITVAGWWRLRPAAEQRRQQQAHLRLLALYLCELLNEQPPPPFRLTRHQFVEHRWSLASAEVAQQLREMLDEAGRLGLILISDRKGGWYEWGRFRSSVEHIAYKRGDPDAANTFLVGIMHLVGKCRDQLEDVGDDALGTQLDALWEQMAGDYWA